MRFFALVLLAVGLAAVGCGSGGEGNDGAGASQMPGGGGGTDSTESSGSGASGGGFGGAGGGRSGTGGSAAGGAGTCDEIGVCGNMGEGCVKCAIEDICAAEFAACFDNDDCGKYGGCVGLCDKDAACVAACDAQFPDGKVLFDAYQACVLCDQCKASCAAMATCPP